MRGARTACTSGRTARGERGRFTKTLGFDRGRLRPRGTDPHASPGLTKATYRRRAVVGLRSGRVSSTASRRTGADARF